MYVLNDILRHPKIKQTKKQQHTCSISCVGKRSGARAIPVMTKNDFSAIEMALTTSRLEKNIEFLCNFIPKNFADDFVFTLKRCRVSRALQRILPFVELFENFSPKVDLRKTRILIL